MTVNVQSNQLEDRPVSDVEAKLPDKFTMKPIPKSIAIPAIAQCSVMCRTSLTSEESTARRPRRCVQTQEQAREQTSVAGPRKTVHRHEGIEQMPSSDEVGRVQLGFR